MGCCDWVHAYAVASKFARWLCSYTAAVQIINATLSRRDVFVLMPTGGCIVLATVTGGGTLHSGSTVVLGMWDDHGRPLDVGKRVGGPAALPVQAAARACATSCLP